MAWSHSGLSENGQKVVWGFEQIERERMRCREQKINVEGDRVGKINVEGESKRKR